MRLSLRLSFGTVIAAASASSFAGAISGGDLVISQTGDGSATLGTGAAAVFLNEITRSGASVQQIALPTSTSGSNHQFTQVGNGTAAVGMNLSTDGQYVIVGGYDAAVGTASVATAAGINRAVARVDMSGNVDTSTTFTGMTANQFRSLASVDGSSFYMATGGSGTYYGAYGSAGASVTQVVASPGQQRTLNIYNGQLYIGTSTSGFIGIGQTATPLPTSATTASLLSYAAGAWPTGSSPYDFVFTNPNTLYVSDDTSTAGVGGVNKYTFDGTNWVRQYGLSGSTLTRSITWDGTNLFAVTTSNSVLKITDGGSAALSTSSVIYTDTTTNTAIRGIRYIPQAVPEPATFIGLGLGLAFICRKRRR